MKRPSLWVERRWRLLLVALLLSAVGVGLTTGGDFGMGTDEPDNAGAARAALESYRSDVGYDRYLSFGDVVAHHGPSYFMVWETLSNGLLAIFPHWHIADGHHFVNYLTFLMGLCGLYLLARRFTGRGGALFTTLFFGTQPLLLGHGFVNQKDTPFWAFLLISLVAGLAAADSLAAARQSARETARGSSVRRQAKEAWRRSEGFSKWAGVVLLFLGVLVVVDLLALERGFAFAASILRQAHAGESLPFINQTFAAIAEDAGKVTAGVYVEKLRWAYFILRAPAMAFGLLLFPLGVRLGYPSFFANQWSRVRRPLLLFLAAGVLLGFTLSIRPIGLLAGGLVGLYWLTQYRLRGFPMLVPYGAATALTTYMTWPFLWEAPFSRFMQSLLFTGSFAKETLYWGQVITSNNLPWHYFPSYLATEMTEPTIPLLLLGTVAAWALWREESHSRGPLLILLVWIAIPLFGLVALNMGVYGNIRHLLFVLVPIGIFAGLGLDWLRGRLPGKRLHLALGVLALTPGVIGLIRLHPYQYSYFNSFIGGVRGASGQHLLDRWCISYREAMRYVNSHARQEEVVAALYSSDVARPFARADLTVGEWFIEVPEEAGYFMTCGFFLGEYENLSDFERVHTVSVQGALLAEIYQRTKQQAGGP